MNEKIEAKRRFTVTKDFLACKLQSDEGYAPEEYRIEKGTPIWADPEHCRGMRWEGREVIHFKRAGGDTTLYVDRATFETSTEK